MNTFKPLKKVHFSFDGISHPMQVRLEHPANGDGYRVLISGDSTVVKAVRTIYQETSTYFPAVPFDIPGVLYITAANASFQSNSPINITVQMPPKVGLTLLDPVLCL